MRKSSYSTKAHDLMCDYLSEFDELGLVYGLLRPSITGEDDLTHLYLNVKA